jgi:hypothetical protein
MIVFCMQDTPVHKAMFIIFYRGESLKNKIYKVCEGFKATIYDCADNMFERAEMLSAIKTEMQDMQIVCITMFTVISYLPVQCPCHIIRGGLINLWLYKENNKLQD